MALSGTYADRFLNLYNDNLLHELQQEGSRLGNIFKREMAKGQKAYFDKIGKTTSKTKSGRLEQMVAQDYEFERRLVTFQTKYSMHIVDPTDMMDMVSDPTSDLLISMARELGRAQDAIIFDAISGSAVVQTNESTASTAIPSSQKIAVSDITYDPDLSAGDHALTPGKLLKARTILEQNYAGTGDYVVIAPAGQMAAVLSDARASNADYRDVKPLESPGLVKALEGYLGMQYIIYEDTGADGSSDELIYVVSREAVKVLERQPLTTKIAPAVDIAGHPDQLHSYFDMGATRMYEEAVVEIACDPRKVS